MEDTEREVAEMLAEATDMTEDEIIEEILGESGDEITYDELDKVIRHTRRVA